jgi:hypothetical protein
MYLPVTPHFITWHMQITINLIMKFCLTHKSNKLKTYTIYFSLSLAQHVLVFLYPVSVKCTGNIFVYTGKPDPLRSSECRMDTLHTLHELSVCMAVPLLKVWTTACQSFMVNQAMKVTNLTGRYPAIMTWFTHSMPEIIHTHFSLPLN